MSNGAHDQTAALDEPGGDIRSELIQLLSDEFTEGGIDNEVVQPGDGSDGAPAQMLVPLGGDSLGRSPNVHVYFLPVLQDPPVMQFLAPLEYDLADGAAGDLSRFIALVNSNLPITGFEMNEASGTIVFRHTQSIATMPLDPGVVAWPLTMIRYAIESFGPLVELVADGGSFDEAVIALAESFEHLDDGPRP